MKLLLDTCALVWVTQEPKRISAKARRAIDHPANELFFSHASIWEIYLKCMAGKLRLPDPPRLWISQQLAVRGITDWPIDLESLHQTTELPAIHKDPFDRLLIAQARVHQFQIASPDRQFSAYPVRVVW